MGVRNMMAFVGANTPMSFDHVCDVITIYRMWTLLIVRWLLLLLQLNTKKEAAVLLPINRLFDERLESGLKKKLRRYVYMRAIVNVQKGQH